MSISVLRLRRKALSLSTSIFNYHRTTLCSSAPALIAHSSAQNPKLDLSNFMSQFRAFRSSNVSFSFPRTPFNDDDRNIGPDDVLFEGCDYNHWLITMDFPKDSKPSAEEMVETYVQTAAKVLGSVEEAKRKIYACSTTTYQGFQVEVSEEVSKKFEGLPGVVFILPDSYIDPTNKEYGGDKYINGTIMHRPPPVHHGRGSGKFGDRNREFNRTNRGRGEYQQGSQTYGNQGSMQGSPSNFAAPQNPQGQQNYGPPRVNERQNFVPTNNSPGGQDGYQGYGRGQVPPSQGYYNHDQKGNSYPQGQSVPPGQLTNNAPPQVGNSGQSLNYGQGAGGGNSGQSLNYGQGAGGGGYGQGAGGGGYGQGAGGGGYGQGAGGGNGQGAGGGNGQGAGGGYGQGAGAISGGNQRQSAAGGYGQGAGAISGGNQRQSAAGGYGQGAGAVSGWNQQQGAVGGYGQGASGGYGQGDSGYSQGSSGGYSQGAGGGYSQGGSGGYSQDAGVKYGQVSGGGVPGHNKISDHGQSYSIHGENERLSQGEQMNDLRQVQQ